MFKCRVYFISSIFLILSNRVLALPSYCTEREDEIVSNVAICLEKHSDSSAKDLMSFAERFSDYQVDKYKTILEKKMADRALLALSNIYKEKLNNFPTEKPVQLIYKVKQCFSQRGIKIPKTLDGKISADKEKRRADAVKSVIHASTFAESIFKEMNNLKNDMHKIVLPRNVRSVEEATKLREAYEKKQYLQSKIDRLNQELIVLSSSFPNLFERGKNIFQYPTGELKPSKLQEKLKEHIISKTSSEEYAYNQNMLIRDRNTYDDGQESMERVLAFVEKNKEKIAKDEDLKKLSYLFEAKEAQSLVDLNNSMAELCDGNIDQLHNHPMLMTSLYQDEIKNSDGLLFQMAHCKLIQENPENPKANWGLLLAGGGLIAMSFVPGGFFAAATIAGGIGFGAYGIHETYTSYHNLQLDKGLIHAGLIDQKKIIDREGELALNGYFSLLDVVSPGFSKIGKAKGVTKVETPRAGPRGTVIRSEESDGNIYLNVGEEKLITKNPFKLYWTKNHPGEPMPVGDQELARAIGLDKFLELKKQALEYHDEALFEFEIMLRENGIPFKKEFVSDGRMFIKIDKEKLKQMGFPAAKLTDKVSDYKDTDAKLRKWLLLQKHDLLDRPPVTDAVFDETPQMDLFYDPYNLTVYRAEGLSDPQYGVYLRMSDLGPLVKESQVTGTTRHELQHRFFEVQRSQNKLESPYHSEFVADSKHSLGATSYRNYQSSEELYNFANQIFWDMKKGYKKTSRFDKEPFVKGINDLTPKLPDYEKEAKIISDNFDNLMGVVKQTKANATKVVAAVHDESYKRTTTLKIDYDRAVVSLPFDEGVKFNRFANFDDLLGYKKALNDHMDRYHPKLGSNENAYDSARYNNDEAYRKSFDAVMSQKKKLLGSIEQSASGLIEKSNNILSFEDEAVVAIHDFKMTTKDRYQVLKEGADLSAAEADDMKEQYEKLYRLARRIGVSAQ